MSIQVYKNSEPEFKPTEYFQGDVKAWGIFQTRDGTVKRRFKADFKGTWEGETFVLNEEIRYHDGETELRSWEITPIDNHHYQFASDDVVGETPVAEVYGNAMNLNYVLSVKTESSTWNLRFDDWFYLLDETRLMNRATVSKFGFTAGEVTIHFEKQ